MLGSGEFKTVAMVVVGFVLGFLLLGAPFIVMNDAIGIELHGTKSKHSKWRPTYLKQHPRDAGGFWNALWSDGSTSPATAEPPEPSEAQDNPFLKDSESASDSEDS